MLRRTQTDFSQVERYKGPKNQLTRLSPYQGKRSKNSFRGDLLTDGLRPVALSLRRTTLRIRRRTAAIRYEDQLERVCDPPRRSGRKKP